MTLAELCEPLFAAMCRLNRAARKGGSVSYADARSQIEALFGEMTARSAADHGLSVQYGQIEPALVFFVDSVIAESGLHFASEWHQSRLAYERDEFAGDEKFFDILDETLTDRSPAAAERLGILYTCLGLGFTGWYTGQPEQIRAKMMECAARLRAEMDRDDRTLCPEAYEHVDTRDLVEPPGAKLMGIGIALVCSIAILFAASWAFYAGWKNELDSELAELVPDSVPALGASREGGAP